MFGLMIAIQKRGRKKNKRFKNEDDESNRQAEWETETDRSIHD